MRPTLQLNFAATKRLDPRITFTRASSATYFDAFGTLNTAQANEARIDHDPITGECKGLLIEEARNNLLTYSEQFDNAAWTKSNATINANAVVAPDGTMTSDALIENAAASVTHSAAQSASFTSGVTYTKSIYIKAGARARAQITLGSAAFTTAQSAKYDLSSGTCAVTSGSATADIKPVGNGWFRCWITATSTVSASANVTIFTLDSANSVTYTGDGTSGLYIWGAQLEAGAFTTSYIPTTTAQATRAADIAQMTGANFSSWYRQDEGTFVVESDTLAVTATEKRVFAVSDGALSNFMTQHYGSSSGGVHASAITKSGVFQYGVSEGPYLANTLTKRALAYKDGSPISVTNGVLGSVAGSATADCPTGLNSLDIGHILNTQHLNGHIARITYYPYRLSNTELQALSV